MIDNEQMNVGRRARERVATVCAREREIERDRQVDLVCLVLVLTISVAHALAVVWKSSLVPCRRWGTRPWNFCFLFSSFGHDKNIINRGWWKE